METEARELKVTREAGPGAFADSLESCSSESGRFGTGVGTKSSRGTATWAVLE